MKAKEEYVDAPRETRSKDITVYAIIFLILLVKYSRIIPWMLHCFLSFSVTFML